MILRQAVFLCSILAAALFVPLSPAAAQSSQILAQKDNVNRGTVGIVSGGITGTYIRVASDLANALDDGYDLRVLPIIGQGSVRNMEDLMLLKGVDIAIVQSDVMDFYRKNELLPNVGKRINYIAKLYNEEIHLLARKEFSQPSDLNGRKVNFGTEGSGTFMTASIVFDDLGVQADVTTHPEPIALEKLRRGEIDALVFVGGKPLNLIKELSADEGLRLLPIQPDAISGSYLPAMLSAKSYPGLIEGGTEIPTVAVGAVLAAYNWPSDHPRGEKVSRFVDRFFTKFDMLMDAPFHPKWKEVDLKAQVPSWQRLKPAEDWLEAKAIQ